MFQMFNVGIQTIDCPDARKLVQEENAQLVDVRTPQEHAQGTLPGSVNLPLEHIHLVHDQLDKARPVILYCRSGQRSARAGMILQNLGFDAVHNLGSITKYLNC